MHGETIMAPNDVTTLCEMCKKSIIRKMYIQIILLKCSYLFTYLFYAECNIVLVNLYCYSWILFSLLIKIFFEIIYSLSLYKKIL